MRDRQYTETELRTLANGVRSNLAAGWRVTEVNASWGPGIIRLAGPDGAELSIQPDRQYSQRIEISGIYPRDHEGHMPDTRMTHYKIRCAGTLVATRSWRN